MTLTRIVIIRLVQTAHLHRVTHLSIIDSKTKGFPRTSRTPTRGPPRSSKTMTSTNCRTMEHTPSICSSWCQMHLWPRHPSQKQARSLMWDSPTLWNWPWTSCPQCSQKCYEEKRSPLTGAKCCTCWNNSTRCHTLFTIVVDRRLSFMIEVTVGVLSVGVVPTNFSIWYFLFGRNLHSSRMHSYSCWNHDHNNRHLIFIHITAKIRK